MGPKPEAKPDPGSIEREALKELLEEARARRQAQAQPQTPKASPAAVDGLLEHLQAQGWTEEEAKLAVVHAVFSLNPDGKEVPVDVRVKLSEAKQQRALREHQQQLEREKAEAQRQAEERAEAEAVARFELLGRSLETSPYKASAAFYEPEEYANAMQVMALRLFEAANERQAELPRGDEFIKLVQTAIEEQVSRRLTRAQQKQLARQAEANTAEAAPAGVKKPGSVPSATTSLAPATGPTGVLTRADAEAQSRAIFQSIKASLR